MSTPYFLVDAFTHGQAGGNPAAVCLLDTALSIESMQRIAIEFALSETAFVMPSNNGFSLRWFTPATEVDLCGHATLAAAHVLWETGKLAENVPAIFETRSGKLSAVKTGSWIALDFPALNVKAGGVPEGLVEALGVAPLFIGRSRFDALVAVASEAVVHQASPNLAAMAQYPDIRGTILTAWSARPEFDFVSRFFAPSVGINEDPVTGSAHCCLGPYWAGVLGRTDLVGYQDSQRGGIVRVSVSPRRVTLSGQAVTRRGSS